MNRHLLTLVIAFASTLSALSANPDKQADESETFYVQLISTQRVGRSDNSAAVRLETGSEFLAVTGAGEAFATAVKRKHFPTLIDGLNAMAVNGWRLSQSYVSNAGVQSTVVWVLEKTVTDRSQLLDGLTN